MKIPACMNLTSSGTHNRKIGIFCAPNLKGKWPWVIRLMEEKMMIKKLEPGKP